MTLIASIITFSKKKKFGKKNVTLDPRHGTLALDMEPSTLDKKIDSSVPPRSFSLETSHFLYCVYSSSPITLVILEVT